MDLTILGITKKQSLILEELLTHGPQTVREISTRISEQRTNCYLLLERLVEQELVERDAGQPVMKYKITDPRHFRKHITRQQEDLKNANNYITKILPELTSLYRLTTRHQGLSYFQSLKGYAAVLDDMANTPTEVLVIGSDTILEKQPAAYRLLQEKIQQRYERGISTKLIFSNTNPHPPNKSRLESLGFEIRANEHIPYLDSEIAIYSNRVALTNYDESLKTLVANDKSLVTSFTSLFHALWATSRAITPKE